MQPRREDISRETFRYATNSIVIFLETRRHKWMFQQDHILCVQKEGKEESRFQSVISFDSEGSEAKRFFEREIAFSHYSGKQQERGPYLFVSVAKGSIPLNAILFLGRYEFPTMMPSRSRRRYA